LSLFFVRQVDESSAELREVKLECQVHQQELQKLRVSARYSPFLPPWVLYMNIRVKLWCIK
jgi:hypothetical protein